MEIKIDRIAYTSDGKRKSSNFTLRTLLSQNLLQNNFMSMQSERLGSPNKAILMYPERIRQKLYPETSRNMKRKKSEAKDRIIVEDKVKESEFNQKNMRAMSSNHENRGILGKRSQSLKFLASKQRPERQVSHQITQRQAPRPITVSKENKTKMKRLLGRINLLARNQLTLEDDEQVEVIFQFLDALSKNENYYQEAFGYINKKLSKLIFLPLPNQGDQDTINLRKVAELSKNHNLISTIYPTTKQKSTYKQLLRFFTQEIFEFVQVTKKVQIQSQSQIEKFQQLIKQKEQLINKLTQKINYYQSHPSQNKYPQLQQLKQQNKLLKTQYEEQIYKINVLNHNLQLLHETQIMHENKIESLKRQIARYELEKLSNVKQVQKSSELKIFEDNVTMLKQMLDRSIIRMGGMKEQYDKLKNYNQTLINERDNLSKRAAVGFGQLTPRPNLKKIFQNYNMNFNEIFDSQLNSTKKNEKKNLSTQKFVDTLIGKFKNYYETYKIQEKQAQSAKKVKKSIKDKQKDKIKQKQKEKEKQKDIFETVMDEVYEAKNQISKTMQSVQEVRIAYNKKAT